MNADTFTAAKREAQRFLEACKRLEVAAKAEGTTYIWMGSKETAAVKRASMDLSRALSAMRARN